MSALEGINGLSAACGGRFPGRLLISTSEGIEHDYGAPQRPYLILGRSAQCDIRLEGSDVSHRHAYLQVIGKRIFCADLGSRTGVHWYDGARPFGWVGLNEHIAIGQYNLRFTGHNGGIAAAAVEQTAPSAGGRLEVSLRFLNARINTDRTRQWQIRRKVTLLGHLPTCHVPLQEPSVSRVHASLLRTPSGVWVVDLLSKEGVEVNGERVAFARLVEDDVLKIGRFRMAVEHAPGEGALVPIHPLNGAGTNGRHVQGSVERWLRIPYESSSTRDASDHVAAPHNATRPANGYPDSQSQPAPGGLSEEFVLSLLSQSASMQQQMMTQQNQMMLLTMQMLSAMHSHHANLVRKELDCVQVLTREIQQIQARLAEPVRATSEEDKAQAAEETPVAKIPQRMPPAANGLPVMPKSSPVGPIRNGRPLPSNSAAKRPISNPSQAAEARPKAGLDGVELQSHLADRLAELERQRSGYWKKIVRVIMG